VDSELRHNVCRLIAGLVVSDDDFAPEELTRHDTGQLQGDMPSPAQPKARPTAAE